MAGRIIATAIIWIAITIILSTTLSSATGPLSNMNGAAIFGITLVLAITALVSMLAVWTTGERDRSHSESVIAKAKRTQPDRVRRLVESLSDDEIYELESMLLNQQQDETNRSGRSGANIDAHR
jgi:hypothetical protein